LQDSLSLTKGQIWLLKKYEASERWEASQQLVEKLVNDLEMQVASLRHSESALETARQAHFDTTDAMHLAQTHYYEANAAVSNLENQAKSLHDANERMKTQLQQLKLQLERNQTQRAELALTHQEVDAQQKNNTLDFSQTEAAISTLRDAVNACSASYQTVFAAFNANQTALMQAEQRLRLEQANQQHVQKSLLEMQAQITRLAQQASQLQLPDHAELAEKQELIAEAELHLAEKEETSQTLIAQENALNASLKVARDTAQLQQKKLHQLEAQIDSLKKLQQTIRSGSNESALSAWLKVANLEEKSRLWQTVRIKSGWETALEAVLGSKLNAIVNNGAMVIQKRPPAALTVITDRVLETDKNNVAQTNGKTALITLVEKVDLLTQAVIEDWLQGVYIVADEVDAVHLAKNLKAGECLVNQQGDIFTRNSVTYFGPQTMLHGVLEREAEIDRLQQEIPMISSQVDIAQKKIAESEHALSSLRNAQKVVNDELRAITSHLHQLKLGLQQLKQQQQHVISRQSVLESEQVIAHQKLLDLEIENEAYALKIFTITEEIAELSKEKLSSETSKLQAEYRLKTAQEALTGLERAHQEKNFNIQLLTNKLSELTARLAMLNEESINLLAREEELQTQLISSDIDSIKLALEAALNEKQLNEARLAEARNAQAVAESALQTHERERMKNEQMLHPMRDKVEASRLAEQEARLHFEQCQADLAASGLNENKLSDSLNLTNEETFNRVNKIKSLETLKTKLNQEIDALGAVNLAAIEELATEVSRRDILNHQSEDLIEASETLENAIKKIDKETRGRLQVTFDEANFHFKSLFTTLFGGGEARLEMLGDEILDTGMQVFAQPPGKKNSTIHLLSGGEKALTALALVFAFFRLNPAPFCLMDEVDAPLDDSNTERFCNMVKQMSENTQFLYVSHNKITMEMAQQLIGVTMQESGVSRIVDVDMEQAVRLVEDLVV